MDTDDGSVEDGTSNADEVVTPDPLIQNITRVDFDITVPAYQSNALRVRVTWGDDQANADWVGDELWSLSLDLPSNTEHLLSIVFSDDNGDIELGSFEQSYRTGFNDAEVFQLTADQFDTDRWDLDQDGVSNLDELIGGTDPQVGNEGLLPIVDNQNMSLLFIANYFEEPLPSERPYMDTQLESFSEDAPTTTTSADVDSNGNGSISISTVPIRFGNDRRGERMVLENSVQWSGTWQYSNDFFLNQMFNSEVTVDGDTRRLVEQGNGSWVGTHTHTWATTVDVTGVVVEGTTYCKVASGTITESYTSNVNGVRTETLTITRESVNDFWRVAKVDEYDGEVVTSEYFARELRMHQVRFDYQTPVSQNDYFFCEFTDL